MAKMGRPRKPRALQALLGNPGKRRLRDEPTPLRRSRPEPPGWLSPMARGQWDDVCDELWRMGVVVPLDEAVLSAFCEAFSLWRTAEGVVATMAAADTVSKGLLMRMPGSGAVVPNPALAIAVKARRDMVAFASALGLAPTARANLGTLEPPAEVDEVWKKYFPKGGGRGP